MADLASKLDELKLKREAIGSQTSVLMEADRNDTPVRPKKMLTILLAALAGLFLGICFALLQDFMDDRVNTVDDARRLLPSLPVLGVKDEIEVLMFNALWASSKPILSHLPTKTPFSHSMDEW